MTCVRGEKRHLAAQTVTAICCLFVVTVGLFASSGQTPQKPDIAVNVKLVTLYATVHNKHGEILRNLTKDDFTVQEDGRPQTIQYFMQESNLPLTLGLLVDTSLSQRQVLDSERDASATFIDHVVREDMDKAFLIHFDREVELLQDLTASHQKLEDSLKLLQTPEDNPGRGQGNGGGGRGFGGGGTLLYDAIYLASNDLMKKQMGRKALIVLTDGVDHGSKETLQTAIDSAQRANTIIYSILFAGGEGDGGQRFGHRGGSFGGPHIGLGGPLGGPGGYPGQRYPREERPDGKKVLEQISKETGGALFEVSKKESIDEIYAHIEDELRNQYSLAYIPNPPDDDSGYHRITVSAKTKDAVVQARDGYFSSH